MKSTALFAKLVMMTAILLCGCAHQTETQIEQNRRITALSHEMKALSPLASTDNIQRFAATAVTKSAELREHYEVDLAPWLHNIEVNSGTKSRGLCYHYARDLAQALRPFSTPEWQLHLVQANPHSILEHNAIVVTAAGKPWQDGLVLDGWRNSGVLYFSPVKNDQYNWQLKPRISPTINAH